jgi:DNA primase
MLNRLLALGDRAAFYHRQLPQAMRHDLNGRGIPDTFIEKYLLGWNGQAITIPVANRDGNIVFMKFAKSPFSGNRAPQMQAPPNSSVELYGWDTLLRQPARVVICDSEFDRLVLEARGFPSVSSTAGAETFQGEWAKHFEGIEHVYICLSRDEAGRRGSERIARLIPKARVVELPEDVSDAADYFVRGKKNRAQFEVLLRQAGMRAIEATDSTEAMPSIGRSWKRAERLKSEVPIARVIGRYTTLRHSGDQLLGRCPLHEDKHPSLHVYPETNSFHCFGCGVGGDALSFLEKRENLTFGQALEALEKIRYSDEYPYAA